ncbi:hypothetical protein LCGC14_2296830 [marine sediment metagenome]|uniref:Uncharacterized protein n=1 Tax=marine sediment metagenome TaxID=412755 RepID=A0A0F9CPM9_9ZZZZ
MNKSIKRLEELNKILDIVGTKSDTMAKIEKQTIFKTLEDVREIMNEELALSSNYSIITRITHIKELLKQSEKFR